MMQSSQQRRVCAVGLTVAIDKIVDIHHAYQAQQQLEQSQAQLQQLVLQDILSRPLLLLL